MTESYRLIQGGQPVAWAEGPVEDARREIVHYAAVYLQDGPVRIERRVGKKWEPWEHE